MCRPGAWTVDNHDRPDNVDHYRLDDLDINDVDLNLNHFDLDDVNVNVDHYVHHIDHNHDDPRT